jgi:hypothetical protein
MDIESISKVLYYDPETGIFNWKPRERIMFNSDRDFKTWNTRFSGKKTGSKGSNGYLTIRIHNKLYLAHRLAYAIHHRKVPNIIDHIDRDRTNNRIINLRNTDRLGNCLNCKKQPGTSSKYKGVSWHKQTKKWHAQCMVSGKRINLGLFECEEEAYFSYLNFMKKSHGDEYFE